MRRDHSGIFRLGFILLFSAAAAAFGQATEGTILGTVTDSSSAPISDARITITSVETNHVRATRTNALGEYVVPDLPIGTYTVSAEVAGFKRATVSPVQLDLKARVRADLRLEIGEVSQS